jgi:hypothetical protein
LLNLSQAAKAYNAILDFSVDQKNSSGHETTSHTYLHPWQPFLPTEPIPVQLSRL